MSVLGTEYVVEELINRRADSGWLSQPRLLKITHSLNKIYLIPGLSLRDT